MFSNLDAIWTSSNLSKLFYDIQDFTFCYTIRQTTNVYASSCDQKIKYSSQHDTEGFKMTMD